jgi:hypothetical protein
MKDGRALSRRDPYTPPGRVNSATGSRGVMNALLENLEAVQTDAATHLRLRVVK